jgi:colanic acid biosynthesis glycosyl transferase WcaI
MTTPASSTRLAILGINYAPEEIGIARYTTDMAVALAARGLAVDMVAGKPYYPAWEVPATWRGGGWRKAHEDGVAITRCAHYVPTNPSGLRRIVHLASFALMALPPMLSLARRPADQRPQVVLCIAPALLSVPVGWLAARLAGAKLWVHIQDFEVEAAFATGLVGETGRLAKLARWVERRILRLADVASSISPQMCRKLVEKGFAPEAVLEVRNWANASSDFCSRESSPYRTEWNLGTRHVCLYSGNIANKQGIDILVEAARLLAHRADITFVICGEGPNRANLVALAQGLTNIRFEMLQPLEKLGDLLSLASVHLLPQIPGAADLVLPSKLTNMLASGRPIVATAEPGTGLYDEVEGCGLCTPPGDGAALARAIETLIDDRAQADAMGETARLRAVERWSMPAIIDRLAIALTTLAGRRAP